MIKKTLSTKTKSKANAVKSKPKLKSSKELVTKPKIEKTNISENKEEKIEKNSSIEFDFLKNKTTTTTTPPDLIDPLPSKTSQSTLSSQSNSSSSKWTLSDFFSKKFSNLAENSASISWFPGHMHSAGKEMSKQIRSVDFIIEVRDARVWKIFLFCFDFCFFFWFFRFLLFHRFLFLLTTNIWKLRFWKNQLHRVGDSSFSTRPILQTPTWTQKFLKSFPQSLVFSLLFLFHSNGKLPPPPLHHLHQKIRLSEEQDIWKKSLKLQWNLGCLLLLRLNKSKRKSSKPRPISSWL